MRIVLSIFFVLLFFSCDNIFIKKNDGVVLAKVFDKYLYASDLEDAMPQNLSKSDSVIISEDFINKWVRKQLLLNKAELNLTEQEKNVQRQIDEYRASLLIFKYEQNYLSQALDTVVTEEEIKAYYEENTSNFILDEHICKGTYIKIPRSANNVGSFRWWFKSSSEENVVKVEEYCNEYATEFKDFNENWVEFKSLAELLPDKIPNSVSYLKYRKFDEQKDTLNHYFVKIEDFHLAGSTGPLNYVYSDIKSIIINKRKIQLIQKLEADIYNDALNHNNFNIY